MKIVDKPDLINYFIEKLGYESYLEIGLGNSVKVMYESFNRIVCKNKIGIDPSKLYSGLNRSDTYNCTSDVFFENNEQKFDIIFVDGLHEYTQVKKDVDNALECLNKNGIIVMHDIGPFNEAQIASTASGTAYKAWMDLVCNRNDLAFSAYFFDPSRFDGDVVGLVSRGKNTPVKLHNAEPDDRSYAVFDSNRSQLLKQKNIDEIIDSLKDLK
jgi:SAM-dependent methyltransferase